MNGVTTKRAVLLLGLVFIDPENFQRTCFTLRTRGLSFAGAQGRTKALMGEFALFEDAAR
jgi:hypothetical protein